MSLRKFHVLAIVGAILSVVLMGGILIAVIWEVIVQVSSYVSFVP